MIHLNTIVTSCEISGVGGAAATLLLDPLSAGSFFESWLIELVLLFSCTWFTSCWLSLEECAFCSASIRFDELWFVCGFTLANMESIFAAKSDDVNGLPIISKGVPLSPMKNIEGTGTSWSRANNVLKYLLIIII